MFLFLELGSNYRPKCSFFDSTLAYCEKTKKLLCINCILEEQHKNYTLVSIKDGYAKEKSKLIDTESKLKELGNKIEGKL